ncbi:MAG: prepilin-type N-terminal cleavage/methylation domain-containing protein [Methylobacteriaceae bacterium]|nr:prepilin-type N-terminal cleavage/methylation domain-containing protein [Methylobacteriaceae bacterium]MBV9246455.1 prepilin-type N-terminal cleavage/methylation domain-containing protein [Methylobacteriaceae bacterium]
MTEGGALRRHRAGLGEAGFTLIEAIVALAIGGFVIAALASVVGQWLGSWDRGSGTLQRAELTSAGLDRIVTDLASAELIPANDLGTTALFEGTERSVLFARRAVAIGGARGLQLVRLAQTGDSNATLLRSQAPLGFPPALAAPIDREPVVLLRAPYRTVFAYAGDDGVWKSTWTKATRLPRAVRVSVVDGAGRAPVFSTTVRVHVDAAPACAAARNMAECVSLMDGTPVAAPPHAPKPDESPQ